VSTFISGRTDCWAHPDTAPGAPASGPAGVEFSQKRAGSEIGAPLLPSESEAVRGCAPACWARPDTRTIFSPSPPPALREGEGRGEEANVYKHEPLTSAFARLRRDQPALPRLDGEQFILSLAHKGSCGNLADISSAGTAPEDWRTPGRFAYFRHHRVARSVLDFRLRQTSARPRRF
jgi:hypothetical protein